MSREDVLLMFFCLSPAMFLVGYFLLQFMAERSTIHRARV